VRQWCHEGERESAFACLLRCSGRGHPAPESPAPVLVVAALGHRRPDRCRGARRGRTQPSGHSRSRPAWDPVPTDHGELPVAGGLAGDTHGAEQGSGRVLDEHAARDRARSGLRAGSERPVGPARRDHGPLGRARPPVRVPPRAHRRRGRRRSSAGRLPAGAPPVLSPWRSGRSAGRCRRRTPRRPGCGVGPAQRAGLGASSSRTASRTRVSPPSAWALARCRQRVSAGSV
jgi:hypothetical protein